MKRRSGPVATTPSSSLIYRQSRSLSWANVGLHYRRRGRLVLSVDQERLLDTSSHTGPRALGPIYPGASGPPVPSKGRIFGLPHAGFPSGHHKPISRGTGSSQHMSWSAAWRISVTGDAVPAASGKVAEILRMYVPRRNTRECVIVVPDQDLLILHDIYLYRFLGGRCYNPNFPDYKTLFAFGFENSSLKVGFTSQSPST